MKVGFYFRLCWALIGRSKDNLLSFSLRGVQCLFRKYFFQEREKTEGRNIVKFCISISALENEL